MPAQGKPGLDQDRWNHRDHEESGPIRYFGRDANQGIRAHVPASTPDGRLVRTKQSNRLIVRCGERLDGSASSLIDEAILAIRMSPPAQIIIELAATRKIFASGMAVLLRMRHQVPHLDGEVFLANCAPIVFSRLARAGILSHFRLT